MADVNVNFVLGNDEPIRADFQLEPDVTYTAEIVTSTMSGNHPELRGRDLPNQHPMSAITGLEDALNGLSDDITAENNRAVEAEEALDNKIDLEADTRVDEITRVEGLISDEETRAKGAEQDLASSIDSNHQAISNHVSNKNNPHEVTKAQVGLGNVENLAPADMPVSTAAQTALNAKVDKVSTANKVYGTDAQGNQTTYDKGSFGQVDDVQVDGVSVVTNKIANLGSMASEDADDYPTLAGNNIFTGTETINQERDGGQTVIDINRGDIVMTHTPSGESLPTGTGFYNSFSLSVSEYPTSGDSFDFYTNIGGTSANYNDTDGNQTSFNVGAGNIDASIYGNDIDVYAYMNDSGVYVSTPTGNDDEEIVNVGYANAHYATTAQGALADTALQPNDNISELTNNLSYQTATQVANSIAVETNNRESADNNLQSQIDAIVSASDVFDIVGTYAELQAYDISTVPVNDIIKVLEDSTHGGAATYYRCIETNNVKSWSYIGSEGASYTKAEADNRFVPQTRTVNNKALSSDITLTATDVGALPSSTVIPTVNDATVTIQKNGSTVSTFTLNQSSNETVNITVPTATSDLVNDSGFITSADLPTNYVTTNTAQDIDAVKTFLGEKAIHFKQKAATNKLGFTLYDTSSSELGAFEYRPNTINGGALLNVSVPYTSSDWVGFRYWGTAVNVIAPKVATAGNYYIPVNFTDGTNTVTATNTGTVNLSSLIPSAPTYTAGTGISITNNAISVTAPTLTNKATGNNSVTIVGNNFNAGQSVNVGAGSKASGNAVAYGYNTLAMGGSSVAIGASASSAGSNSTVIGYGAQVTADTHAIAIGAEAISSASMAIQLGRGTNSTAQSLSVGFGTFASDNYQLLDGTTGLIPDARISSNIARTSAIPSAYGAGLSYSSSSLQLLDQNGNNLGSAVTIKSTPDLDGVTIDTNSDDELEAIGVIDNNGNAIKTWTGTLAQYNAIVTKDSNTLYNITDDVSVTQTILETLYPVGSLYIGKMSTCPLASLIPNSTWTLVASDKVLQGSGTYTAGTSVSAGVPNISGHFIFSDNIVKNTQDAQYVGEMVGCFTGESVTANTCSISGVTVATVSSNNRKIKFSADSSNSIYGASNTVQPPAYVVNIWERTA